MESNNKVTAELVTGTLVSVGRKLMEAGELISAAYQQATSAKPAAPAAAAAPDDVFDGCGATWPHESYRHPHICDEHRDGSHVCGPCGQRIALALA